MGVGASHDEETRIEDVMDLPLAGFMLKLIYSRTKEDLVKPQSLNIPKHVYRSELKRLRENALTIEPEEISIREQKLEGESKKDHNKAMERLKLTLLGLWDNSQKLNTTNQSYGFSPWNAKPPVSISLMGDKKYWTEISYNFYGKQSNFRPMLMPHVFEKILGYLGGDSAMQQTSFVCVGWFLLYHQHLLQYTSFSMVNSFIKNYEHVLRLKDVSITPQDLFTTADKHSRIDLVLYCELLPCCENQMVEVSHMSNYDRSQKSGPDVVDGISFPSQSTFVRNEEVMVKYEFLVKKRGVRRNVWMLSDRSRQHGDEVCVSEVSFTTVCVGDIVEIPINIVNEFAKIESIRFLPPNLISMKDASIREEPAWGETIQDVWRDLKTYKQLCLDRIDDWSTRFEPQLKSTGVHAIGIAQTCVRQSYEVKCEGLIPNSFSDFGQIVNIFPQDDPIVVTISRSGLRHDRFQDLSLRVGDNLTIYRLVGGPIEY